MPSFWFRRSLQENDRSFNREVATGFLHLDAMALLHFVACYWQFHHTASMSDITPEVHSSLFEEIYTFVNSGHTNISRAAKIALLGSKDS